MLDSPDSKIERLRVALAFFLEDDNYIDRMEAEGLKAILLQGGPITEVERRFMREAIQKYNFDSQALAMLKQLIQMGI